VAVIRYTRANRVPPAPHRRANRKDIFVESRLPTGLILDLDGTLIESHDLWFAIMGDVARRYGVPPPDRLEFERTFGQPTEEDAALFFPGARVEDLDALYAELWPTYAHLTRRIEHAADLLSALRASGVAVACATNSSREFARAALEAARLDVQVLACADEVPRPKPAPDVIQLAAARLGLSVDQCVMIGDSCFDIGAARAAGCPSIGIRVEADATVNSLGELLGLWCQDIYSRKCSFR
jgi:HAD superfamily hydrolase (TIGR01509 family)